MFELQPTIENDLVLLLPLTAADVEKLYSVASEPLLWKQHPNSDSRSLLTLIANIPNRKKQREVGTICDED